MTQTEWILESVQQAFDLSNPDNEPQQSSIYIFFLIKSGLILFKDAPVDTLLLNNLIEEEILKPECGDFYHQCEKSIRYKFTGYKYPSKYYRFISTELRTSVYERDNYTCVTCGATKRLTCDHITPWSLGGYTEFYNLQTLCHTCNSIKHNN